MVMQHIFFRAASAAVDTVPLMFQNNHIVGKIQVLKDKLNNIDNYGLGPILKVII